MVRVPIPSRTETVAVIEPPSMKKRQVLALLAGCFSVPAFTFSADAPAPVTMAAAATPTPVPYLGDPTFPQQPTPPALTPEEELKTFQLPKGYHMELVLSDPLIKEPVMCTFDGNGRMYVAELRSYMQDADRKDEKAPISRVSRHESTEGDGVYDKHTVFLDNALLPRMVLPLDKGTGDDRGDRHLRHRPVQRQGGPRGGGRQEALVRRWPQRRQPGTPAQRPALVDGQLDLHDVQQFPAALQPGRQRAGRGADGGQRRPMGPGPG